MSTTLLFVLTCLAAYRLWRLLGADMLPIVKGPRDRLGDWIAARHGDDWADGFTSCPWCLGFWCSCIVVALVWAYTSLPLPALWFPAVSTVVGLVGSNLED